MGTKPILVLMGLVVVMAAAEPAVTVYNPAGLVVDIWNGDENVKVVTKMVTVNLTQAKDQDLQFSLADWNMVDVVTVQDGDVLVMVPDPDDLGTVHALKVQVGGAQLLTPPNPPEWESNPSVPEVMSPPGDGA